MLPVYHGLHTHVNEAMPSKQVPPFKHGLLAHSSPSEERK